MRKGQDRYHHGDLRRAAIEASERELERHGAQGFKLERVAKSVGVTVPALYRHFENKDALLRAVIWDVFLRFVAAVDGAVVAAAEPKAKLAALGKAYVRFALKNPGWFRLQFSRTGTERLAVRHDESPMKYPEEIVGALRRLLGDEAVVERWFLLLWGAAHGIAGLLVENVWAQVATEAEQLALADALIDTLVAAVVPPTSPGVDARPSATFAKIHGRQRK